MTRSIHPFVLTVLISVSLNLSANAAPNEELVRHFSEEIGAMQEAIDRCNSDTAPVDAQQAERWFLRRFWLRVRAKTAFKIPGIAKVEIIPETELLWERALPVDWEAYKP